LKIFIVVFVIWRYTDRMKNKGSVHYEIQEAFRNIINPDLNENRWSVYEEYPRYDYSLAEFDLNRIRKEYPGVDFRLVEITTTKTVKVLA